jgi:hypothetical protein
MSMDSRFNPNPRQMDKQSSRGVPLSTYESPQNRQASSNTQQMFDKNAISLKLIAAGQIQSDQNILLTDITPNSKIA